MRNGPAFAAYLQPLDAAARRPTVRLQRTIKKLSRPLALSQLCNTYPRAIRDDSLTMGIFGALDVPTLMN
jgi:hypothetical protein